MQIVTSLNGSWKCYRSTPEFEEYQKRIATHRNYMRECMLRGCRDFRTYNNSYRDLVEAKRKFVELVDWHPYADQFRKAWPAL